jgi:hypothetical protein
MTVWLMVCDPPSLGALRMEASYMSLFKSG